MSNKTTKRLMVRWTEVVTYQASITVPADYPETLDGVRKMAGDGNLDWYERTQAGPDALKEVLEVGDVWLQDVHARKQQASQEGA